jgi:dolichol-phosphate mannosyltransferase
VLLEKKVVMQSTARQSLVSLVPTDSPRLAPTGGEATRVAVVIPCFRVTDHILEVIAGIGAEVDDIYVVDDACPERSGELVERRCRDPRVRVLRHAANQGVGGATVTGIERAIADGAAVIVKMDGDGQMDPAMLPILIDVILSGQADYAKGNRFFDPESVSAMPTVRLLGNAGLSFFAKISTGYWQSFDPTNGYVAIHAEVAKRIPLAKLSRRYFFETDLLFRLSTLKARVVDIPMPAIYGDETSGLNAARAIVPFAFGHLRNFCKRVAYNYFLRDFSIASVQLVAGLTLLLFGLGYGLWHWLTATGLASAGTVMLAGLSVLLGVQMLLAFFSYDIQSSPSSALHPRLAARTARLGRKLRATTG